MQLHAILNESIAFKTENCVVLTEQLDRKDFTTLKSLFQRVGGQWNNTTSEFNFRRNAQGVVNRILDLGPSSVNKFHLYPSTPKVFDFMKEFTPLEYMGAGSRRALKVLEPSIGFGFLAESLSAWFEEEGRVCDINGYDIDPLNVELCRENGFKVQQANFLSVVPEPIYDLVIMNPPFNKSEFVDHVQHASKFLKPDGVLLSVVPVNMERLQTDDQRHSWLMDRIRLWCPEQLEEGNYLDHDTFKNVSVPTTVITFRSEEHYAREIASKQTIDSQLYSLAVSIDNDSSLLQELAGRNNGQFSNGVIDNYIDECLHRKIKQEFYLHPGFHQNFKKFIKAEYLPLTAKQNHPVSMFNLLFGESLSPVVN